MGSGTGSSPALTRAMIKRRPLTGLLRAEHPVPAHRDPFRSARFAGLGNIDLTARGIDPYPEACKLP